MTTRGFAAGIVLVGLGAMATPAETLAAATGHIAAAPFFARGAHPPLTRPLTEMRFRHRHDFPVWWGYAGDVVNDAPLPYPPPYAGYPYPPPYAVPSPDFPYPPGFYQRSGPPPYPRCRTDTQKVASETGGERTINITRCY
jgi:hypothetical protein